MRSHQQDNEISRRSFLAGTAVPVVLLASEYMLPARAVLLVDSTGIASLSLPAKTKILVDEMSQALFCFRKCSVQFEHFVSESSADVSAVGTRHPVAKIANNVLAVATEAKTKFATAANALLDRPESLKAIGAFIKQDRLGLGDPFLRDLVRSRKHFETRWIFDLESQLAGMQSSVVRVLTNKKSTKRNFEVQSEATRSCEPERRRSVTPISVDMQDYVAAVKEAARVKR